MSESFASDRENRTKRSINRISPLKLEHRCTHRLDSLTSEADTWCPLWSRADADGDDFYYPEKIYDATNSDPAHSSTLIPNPTHQASLDPWKWVKKALFRCSVWPLKEFTTTVTDHLFSGAAFGFAIS